MIAARARKKKANAFYKGKMINSFECRVQIQTQRSIALHLHRLRRVAQQVGRQRILELVADEARPELSVRAANERVLRADQEEGGERLPRQQRGWCHSLSPD